MGVTLRFVLRGYEAQRHACRQAEDHKLISRKSAELAEAQAPIEAFARNTKSIYNSNALAAITASEAVKTGAMWMEPIL